MALPLNKQELLSLIPDNTNQETDAMDVREILHYNNVYGGVVSSDSGVGSQSIPIGTSGDILTQWDFVLPDNGIEFSLINNAFTVLSNGTYFVEANISFNATSSSILTLYIAINNISIVPGIKSRISHSYASTADILSLCGILEAQFNDEISLYVAHDKGSPITFDTIFGQFLIRRLE